MTIMELSTEDIDRELKLMNAEKTALGTVGSGLDEIRSLFRTSEAVGREVLMGILFSEFSKGSALANIEKGQSPLLAITQSKELMTTAVTFFQLGLRLGRAEAPREVATETAAPAS